MWIQADTSAPTNRIAAVPVGRLSRWDVVDTGTLYERQGNLIHKEFFMINKEQLQDNVKFALSDYLKDWTPYLLGILKKADHRVI
jgi:hypothetical protein